jgi:hypothetical protein
MVRVVGIEPTLLSEPDFEGVMSTVGIRLVADLTPFKLVHQRLHAPTLHLAVRENPPMCTLQPENTARHFEGGFQYRHLSFSIASAMQEIEHGEDRNYANSENNPAAPVARDGADG